MIGNVAPPRSSKPVGDTRSGALARWVVFSTFDPAGQASESAVAQVRAYRAAGFDVMVVDTSERLADARRTDWEREATSWFQRVNVGYDFGSFKAGLARLTTDEHLQTGNFDVVFANDSCFGPYVSLAEIIETFDRFPPDARHVFGITDSVQECHHIQSYWIYFRSDVVHLAIEFFLERMIEAAGRSEAIVEGEIALGRFLLASGCVLKVACPVYETLERLANFNGWLASSLELGIRRLLKRWKYSRDLDTQCLRYLLRRPDKMIYFNPIVLFGVQLHRMRVSPFVKKSMIRENVYEDPAVPAGLNPNLMTNADVLALFR